MQLAPPDYLVTESDVAFQGSWSFNQREKQKEMHIYLTALISAADMSLWMDRTTNLMKKKKKSPFYFKVNTSFNM